jgi:hypothetical protein
MSTQPEIACFSLNPYKDYCGTLVEFRHSGAGVELVVEVDPETWETVDLLMFFNLGLDKRHPGRISGTKPVQIAMFLDGKLYEKLKSSGELLADKNAFMTASPAHPMRSTVSWFATEVTEEVDLPADLKAKGTVREGFTTVWKN